MSKSFNWVFTINNPVQWVKFKPKTMQYMVQSPQIGKEKKTKHLQCFVQFKCEKALAGFNQQVNQTTKQHAHGEIARAGYKQAVHDYILNGETNTFFDKFDHIQIDGKCDEDYVPVPRQQGKRSDLKSAMAAVKDGASDMELCQGWPNIMARNAKFIAEYRGALEMAEQKEIKFPVDCEWFDLDKPDGRVKRRHIWLWGPPDIGKSIIVQQALMGTKTFMAGSSDKYRYEGYDDEEIIIYDDIVPSVEEILQVTQVHLIRKERYGDIRYGRKYWKLFQARTIIILHNEPPPFSEDQFHARVVVFEADPRPHRLQRAIEGASAPPGLKPTPHMVTDEEGKGGMAFGQGDHYGVEPRAAGEAASPDSELENEVLSEPVYSYTPNVYRNETAKLTESQFWSMFKK